jgi:putative multiple sugar transport system permease protein
MFRAQVHQILTKLKFKRKDKMAEKQLDNFEVVENVEIPRETEAGVKELSLKDVITSNLQQYGIIGALIAIVIFFQISTGGLLLLPNSFVALIQQNAYVLLLAMGMVMVIVDTHIDLSVGSQVAFVGAIAAILMEQVRVPWYVAIVACLGVGLVIGAWHGFWVAYVGIPGFITTLAGMLLFRGFATVLAGESIPIKSEVYRSIAKSYVPNFLSFIPNPFIAGGFFDVVSLVVGALGITGVIYATLRKMARAKKVGLPQPATVRIWNLITMVVACLFVGFVTYLIASSGNVNADGIRSGGIPITLVIIAIPFVFYTFLTTKTVFGRHIYATGGNRKAAILSGVNTKMVDFKIYVHMGFLTALASLYMLSRNAAATAMVGQEYELDAIASCFIGGTAVTGGIGTVPGAMIGAFVMGVLNQGLSLMGVSSAWVKAIKGLVLLGAVALDIISKRRSK